MACPHPNAVLPALAAAAAVLLMAGLGGARQDWADWHNVRVLASDPPPLRAEAAFNEAGDPASAPLIPSPPVQPAAEEHAATLSTFMATWCLQCHSGRRVKGDLNLSPAFDMLEATAHPRGGQAGDAPSGGGASGGASTGKDEPVRLSELAAIVRPRLVARDMPPRDPMPAEEEYRAAIAALDALAAAERAAGSPGAGARAGSSAAATAPPAGRVTARRLNRFEYANSVRDLLGVDFDPARLPVDEVGHGFDNNGDVLSIPPLLLEKYLDAAEAIAAEAIVQLDGGEPRTVRLRGMDLRGSGGARDAGNAWSLYSTGQVEGRVQVARRGRYRISVVAQGQQAGPEPVKMTILCDGKAGAAMPVEGQMVERTLEQVVELGEGAHRIGAAFINDFYKPDHPDPKQRDRNAYIREVALVGPLDRLEPTPLQVALASAAADVPPDSRLAAMTAELAARLWRRPAEEAEIADLVAMANEAVTDGGSPASLESRRLRTILTALLVHPRFLLRLEAEPPAGQDERELDAWELASRLSYFLWSTAPDDALRRAASDGTLATAEGRAAAVRRMLDDPRSLALAEHFATQWLRIRSIEERVPDPERFPGANASLLESMRQETILFFDDQLRSRRPLSGLLRSDQTFLNEALARHYGIPGVRGDHLRRVVLTGPAAEVGGRSRINDLGLLRHGSVLLATSNPARTSPVKRGKWVLEALLDEPPPPAPPGIPPLPEERGATGDMTIRQLMERHRADPDCAGCHRRMDAMGFALEEFDAVGRFRREEDGRAIDAAGQLPDGRAIAGANGLREEILRGEAFTLAFIRHLLTYALGRGLTPQDAASVERIQARAGPDPTMAAVIEAIVESRPFRFRAAPEGSASSEASGR